MKWCRGGGAGFCFRLAAVGVVGYQDVKYNERGMRLSRYAYGAAWLAVRDAVRDRGYAPSAYGAFVLGGFLGITP